MTFASPFIEPQQESSVVEPSRMKRTCALVFLVVWTISVVYMAAHLNRDWSPHDEGTLGQSAERVLRGELPHRDFDDYTGGLTFVHALAFRELGISSGTMRIVLFVFFVAWVPAVLYVASRFVPVYTAGVVTLLAVAWSVPNYPGPMPSWYNLFFATFGAATLLRHLETGNSRWIFLAGLCAGLSSLAKITAAYFIAGALLFFIYREQAITSEQDRQPPARARFYSAAVALGLLVFLILLFRMIHQIPGAGELIYFVLPAVALVMLLVSREFAGIAGGNSERFRTLVGMCLPFGLGVAIPAILFLAPYLFTGSVHDLVHGLLATPARAIRFATFKPQNPLMMVTIVPMALPVIVAYECGTLGRAICGIVVALYGGLLLMFASRSMIGYSLGWCSLATLIPLLVVAGVAMLWVAQRNKKLDVLRQQQFMLIMSVAGLCSLVQFPFAAPIYFFYAAPLVILFAAALLASTNRPPGFVLGALIVFYLLFPSLRATPFQMGLRHLPTNQTGQLNVARASSLRVDSSDARLYNELIPLIQTHSAGKFIYAAPDCPEVYFLSGLQSPTRHFFEYSEDSLGHSEQTLRVLETLDVNVVAINKDPGFSGQLSAKLQSALEIRYPHSAELGRFQVRWKE